MTLKLAVNGIPLLAPHAGIGQYVLQLMREVERRADIETWYFYGFGWDRRLRETSPAVPGLNRLKLLLQRLAPDPHALRRLVSQARFTRGARRLGVQLYHEPSFLPFAFDGPLVLTVHDLSCFRWPALHPRGRVRSVQRHLPAALARAARVLVDSDFVNRELQELFGIAPDKIVTAHLGVSSAFRPMTESETRPCLAAHGLQHGKYLLTVGTLEPRKNLALTVRAYQRLPESLRREYPLVIAGASGWHTEVFLSELRRLMDGGQVKLLGYVPGNTLPALYAGATMLVYPSLYEGFGLPPLEGMACGIPVVVSDRASLPEVVGDAGLLIDPDDDRALHDAIRALLDDPAERRRRCQRGLERARLFSWEKCAQQTVAAYHQAACS